MIDTTPLPTASPADAPNAAPTPGASARVSLTWKAPTLVRFGAAATLGALAVVVSALPVSAASAGPAPSGTALAGGGCGDSYFWGG